MPPNLERLAAEQIAACLQGVPVGSPLAVDSSSDLCDTLELLIPEILRREHPEWERESIDGFFFSTAVKSNEGGAELWGTCILISDQTVTPFWLDLSLSDPGVFEAVRIKLGEPGAGALGISGPVCTSRAAVEMLDDLNARLEQVAWVYEVTV